MAKHPPARPASDRAWLITYPLALVALILTVGFWIADPDWWKAWPVACLFFLGYLLALRDAFFIVIRRGTFTFAVTDVPFVLALFYLPPVMVIIVVVGATLTSQYWSRMPPAKLWFNGAKSAAGSTAAVLLLAALPDLTEPDPGTWLALAAAAEVASLVEFLSLTGVLSLVQDVRTGRAAFRAGWTAFVANAVCVVIGLTFLVALEATMWSAILLAILTGALVVVLRSYTEFYRRHQTLADVYELTQALRDSGSHSSMPDVLLGRVRALMQSEFATLWLAPQGRHPEVLLTARLEHKGLLDIEPTPEVVRKRALETQAATGVGNRFPGTEDLRPHLRAAKVKDVLVIPLRSGKAVIGTLEVANRLGDNRTFRETDVQVLETIAAHAAVALENSRLVDRLRYDAYHDRLTGLPNRRRVIDALAEAVKVRAEDEVVAIMLFDVDGQRNVNESMGHAAGDKLLSETADRLRRIADSGALVGRIGGDEFVVTLRAPSIDATIEIATRMRERLRGPMAVGSLTLDVNTAVGVSVYPDHGNDPETLLQRAELAANAAKVLPYGVQPFHPALESRAVRRLGIAADLRRALDNDQLEVYFQPKVTLADRHVVGVECLARWVHPAHGEVAPEDFVAVAEHTGQLARLTEVVLVAGLKRCRSWSDAERPFSVAVNLSARILLDSRFPELVRELLEEHGVEPGLVTFEISEPGMLSDIERVLPSLYRLRDLGVRLSVDDFGTGASSLAYLRQWPVHEVKIDDSFVQGMATDSGDLAIVRAVIGLSREFGLTVVAEGVESELTLELLEEMGCEIGQGYLFSRPLPFERLEAWLNAQTEPESTPTGEVRRLRAVI
ncbi:putative bifunctional diguanylate cyclase/phosphodiesterase [Actinoplanes utahensis]|uniref:Diguanylate cyclase n=1 Tax=Actinoplanes utahensis TaxID=1869 RepID=A0A0A6UCP9_ACTUT|nr:bifunctional diguanylate cyclase/phosphodiesterase [Actinoplanes utahensis]KHD73795.1 diguanylate cyclase [Actinoplanes utahensis]GIF27841.1 bifunctional diguanylate cyclase/phosphodiesterase [Actinoplanes utahensis]